MSQDDLVQVLVPRRHLGEVYRVLGKLDAQAGGGPDGAGGSDADEWSSDDLEKLANARKPSLERVSVIMDYLSGRPGQEVSLTDLANAVGLTRGAVSGALSGLTRWMNREWGGADWPLDVTWGTSASSARATEAYYSVTHDMASRWSAVRSGG